MVTDKTGKKLSPAETWYKLSNRIMNVLLEFKVFIIHLLSYFPSHNLRKIIYRLGGMKIGSGSTIHIGVKFYEPKNIIIGQD